MHYTAYFEDGKKIDSSRDRNYPYAFNVGKGAVIKGWEEIIPGMSLNEQATIFCPAEHAYGANGISGVIPANANLKFEV